MCGSTFRNGGIYLLFSNKGKYTHIPTYDLLKSSLIDCKNHAEKSGITRLCIPVSGVDWIDWSGVRFL